MTSAITEERTAAEGTTGAVVQASEITRVYGEGDTAVHALNGCSVDVVSGELTAVMGPSGSGKSTMMHILAGLDRPTSGSVSIAGTDITKLGDNELTKLRRKHIGFIFQFFNLLPMLNAEENIRLPLELAGDKIDEAWVEEVIKRTGLDDRRTHRPSELSGGQQQRVAIARALASRPTVIFADEPTGNLDSHTSAEILDLLREMVTNYGQTTVMVTHDAHAAAIADRSSSSRTAASSRSCSGAEAGQILRAMEEVEPAMIRVALRGPRRAASSAPTLTAFAIILGVATGELAPYVLTDTIDKAFDNIFTDSRQGSSVVISGKSAFDLTDDSGATAPPLNESLLQTVREQPDVAAAEGSVNGEAQLIGDDNKAIVYGGAPNLGFSIENGNSPFNPLSLVEGSWPSGDEVVIDGSTADKEGFVVGDTVGVQGRGPVEQLRISGIVKFGSVSTIGGATLAGFDLPTAQRVFDMQGKLDEIAVAAKAGVSDEQLAQALGDILPPKHAGSHRRRAGAKRREGHELVHQLLAHVPALIRRHRAFRRRLRDRELPLDHDRARTRELATLRTVGASRRQVLNRSSSRPSSSACSPLLSASSSASGWPKVSSGYLT